MIPVSEQPIGCDNDSYRATTSVQPLKVTPSEPLLVPKEPGGPRVTFTTVEVFEFDIELGVNPPSSGGPPIGGALRARKTWSCSLKAYEWARCSLKAYECAQWAQHGGKKPTNSCWLPPQERQRLLEDAGIPAVSILFATHEAVEIRKQREETKRMGWP